MPTYTQENRPLAITTALGKDKLLLVAVSGHEAMSSLFKFEAETLATEQVAFDGVLGKSATLEIQLPKKKIRYVNGIVSSVMEGGREKDPTSGKTFITYRLEIVPKLWFLTRKSHSRMFQQKSVPDILKTVLTGLDIDTGGLQGKYEPRDYCVQYRETDFNFASRLMEEEGIYYYFEHSDGSHKMFLSDTTTYKDLSSVDSGNLIFEEVAGGTRDEDRVYSWSKTQEIRTEKITLWDQSFELPHKHLEGNKDILDSAQVGTVSHKLKVGGSENLELYDWPGEYAQRFDGVTPGGGDQPAEIQKIFQDNQRTAGLRMGEQAAGAVTITGSSKCRGMTSGYKFSLDRHPTGKGSYLLTSVSHSAHHDSHRGSGPQVPFDYNNSFTCIPVAIPFRPQRVTPKPVIHGTQTAVVVGPAGEEIFTDKYGRVHVRFHWDREEKSACWVRVGQLFAGKRWGSSFWPRIGQEVIVAFEEGDPDRPIIVGSVYNADQMPPYLGNGPDPKHAIDNKVSGIKTCSTKGGNGYNELRFDDTKGKEQVFVRAEKDTDTYVQNDRRTDVGGNIHLTVGYQGGNSPGGSLTEKFKQTKTTHVEQDIDIYADDQHTIYAGTSGQCIQRMKKDGNFTSTADMTFSVKAGESLVLESGMTISLSCGASYIVLGPEGITISGPFVYINSPGASAGSASDLHYVTPPEPDKTDNSKTGLPSNTGSS